MITDKWRRVDIPNVVFTYLADAVIDLSDDITTLVKCYEGGEVEGLQILYPVAARDAGPAVRHGRGNPSVFDPGGGRQLFTGPECKTGLSNRTKARQGNGLAEI